MGILKINFSENAATTKEIVGIPLREVCWISPIGDGGQSCIVLKDKVSAWQDSEKKAVGIDCVYVDQSFNSLCYDFARAAHGAVVLDLTKTTQSQPFAKKTPSAKP